MFRDFIEELNQNNWEIHGIQIVKDSKLIHQYGDCITRYPIYSATKSILSLAVGIAVQEEKMSIDEPVYRYICDIVPDSITKSKIDILNNLSIKRLLTMSIPGLPFRPQGDNWLEYSINCLPDDITKNEFQYSNIPAYLTGLAVSRAVGEHVISYLQPRLFDILEIKEPIYQNCPGGYFYGASGMQLSVEELGKIGQLCFNRGMYQGKRVVSEKWLNEAVKKQIECREGGYGFYFWRFDEGYRISGKWGQRCIVIPPNNLIITYLSDMEEGSEQVTDAVKKYLIY